MRFLVDAQLPPALADWLRSRGFEADHVFDTLGAHSPDLSIAQASAANGAIVISKDQDFLSLQSGGEPQVIWVRIGNSTNRHLILRFEAEWSRIEQGLSSGAAVVELD